MSHGTSLEAVFQQLITDVEATPDFTPERVADVKRACDLMRGMVEGGSVPNDAIHAVIFTLARILMMATPAENELHVREQYTRLLFDYMTGAMHTKVCPDCGYPHPEEAVECDEEPEGELAEAEVACYTPPSTPHLH